MKKQVTLALAVLLLGSSAAMAQYQGNDRRDEQRGYQGPAAVHEGDRQVWDTPHWNRGDRMAREFAQTNHVEDWRGNHLRQPPRGYHWVRSGHDYVLAHTANGTIREIIHGRG